VVDVTSRLRLVVDSSGVDKAGKSLRTLGRESARAEKQARALRSAFAGIGAALGGIASVNFIKLFNEQARAVAKVEQAIKSTGGSAGFTSKELQKVASELQGISLFGDERILNEVTAQLLTFGNIADEQFLRAQRAALDLSTLLDGDLKSASIQLGKALDNPLKGLTALTKSGVGFAPAQQEVIKNLTKTGQLAKAQNIILDAIQQQYGGQAERAAQVGTGPLTQLQGVLADIGELFGKDVFEPIRPAIIELKAFLEIDENKATVVKVMQGVVVAIGAVGAAFAASSIAAGIAGLFTPIGMATAAIGAVFVALGSLVALRDDIAEWATGVADAGAVAQAAFEVLGPIISNVINAIGGLASGLGSKLTETGEELAQYVGLVREALVRLIPDEAKDAVVKFAEGAQRAFAIAFGRLVETVGNAAAQIIETLGRALLGIAKLPIVPDLLQSQLLSAAKSLEVFSQAVDKTVSIEGLERLPNVFENVKSAAASTGAVMDEIRTRAAEIAASTEQTDEALKKSTQSAKSFGDQIGVAADKSKQALDRIRQQQAEQEELIAAALLGEREERIAREVLNLRRELGDQYKGDVRALAEQNVALEEQLDIIREQRELLQRPFDDLERNLQDAIINGGNRGVDGLKDIFDGFIDSLKRSFVEALTGPLFDSIQRQLSGALSFNIFGTGALTNGTFGPIQSSSLADPQQIPQFGGAGAAGAFGAFGNLASLVPLLTLFGGQALGQSIPGFAFSALGAVGGGALVSALGKAGLFGSSFGGIDKFISNQLKGAGSLLNIGGGIAGSIGAGLLFGESTEQQIGSTVGGIAGNLIPIPFLGPLLGSILGGGLGSLLSGGTGKASGSLNLGDGTIFDVNQSKSDSRNQRLNNVLISVGSAVNQLAEILGGTVDPGTDFRAVVGNKQLSTEFFDAQGNLIAAGALVERTDELGAITQAILAALDGVIEGADESLSNIAQSLIAAQVPIDQSLAVLQTIKDVTAEAEEPLDQYEQAIKDLNDTIDAAIQQANGVAAAEEALNAARERGIELIRQQQVTDFNQQIQDDLLQYLDDPLQQLERLLEAQEKRLVKAQEIGADIGEVERLTALELREFFQSLTEESLNEVSAFLGLFNEATNAVVRNLDLSRQDLRARADAFGDFAQQFSDLSVSLNERFIAASPRESLGILRGRATDLLGEVQQGNESAAQSLPQVLSQIIENARSAFGNTKEFTETFNFVQDILAQAEQASLDIQTEAERQIAALDENNDILADIRDILSRGEATNAFFQSFVSGGVASSSELLKVIQSGAGLTFASNDNAAALNITGLIGDSIKPVISPLVDSIGTFTSQLSELPSLQRIHIEATERVADRIDAAANMLADRLERIEIYNKKMLEELDEAA
jgi:hypothetical protein